ncbi:alkyl sulfatase C-terminal domain-containing protein, partial [Bacillus sp. SIMBA_074]
PADDAQLHLTSTRVRFLALAAGDTTSDGLTFEGDATVLARLTAVLDAGDPDFNIVVP